MSRTPQGSRKKSVTKPSAAQIAAQSVAEWHAGFLSSSSAYVWPDSEAPDDVLERVQDALQREHIAKHGPLKDEVRLMLAQEAGYLLGVQVGLRLRAEGGAR